ncbi:MAG TPA: gephyrin-like molybdotransferase Glp, partial [Gemmatimonadales bacterium]|nr:gephyrin-like molybdotransferase Glp [Gemmatimonadales bacterium]
RRAGRAPFLRHHLVAHARVPGVGPRLAAVIDTSLGAAEAARRILADIRRQPPLRVPLDDALDSVLAEDLVSPIDLPAWANSAMDGYAARAADIRGASAEHPVRLRVVEELPAGRFPSRAIGPGETSRIYTGAPVPDGADGVVRQEDTDLGRETVTIFKDRDAGVNIRPAGEDIQRGTTVLRAGTPLGPAELGVLASLAVGQPLVYRRPRVAILGSGDEIVDVDRPDEILSGRKTANSNAHALVALVRRAGGEPVNLGVARDAPESLREHIQGALPCDLLVTTAGVSVGEHDYVRTVLDELGVDQRFWRIRMRPGAPLGFGLLGRLPWIGLPGNPVSTMVTFELFVRPAIRQMCGHALPFRRMVPVRTAEAIALKPKLQHFLRAVVTETARGREARLTGPQGSGILMSMVLANALLVVPEGQLDTPAGAELRAMLHDEPVHQAEPGFD